MHAITTGLRGPINSLGAHAKATAQSWLYHCGLEPHFERLRQSLRGCRCAGQEARMGRPLDRWRRAACRVVTERSSSRLITQPA